MTTTTRECRCGRPTRDSQYVCDSCSKTLSIALGDVAWLEGELETSLTGAKGVDYRTLGGTRASEIPSPVAWSVSEASGNLRAILVSWTKFCADEKVRNSSPRRGMPANTLAAISAWLLWRVDGLALLDIGGEAVDEIVGAVKSCTRLIDRAPDRMYAGRCGAGDCETDLYAKVGARTLVCPTCATEWDVAARRTFLLSEAEEVLATAVELARAVSWLGVDYLTTDRVRQWASRGRLLVRGHSLDGHPMYRVGDAIDLLSGSEPVRPVVA